MRNLLFVIVSMLLGLPAIGETDAVAKYRSYTPQQIADMPDDERSSSVPMMYTMAASTGMSTGSELLFAMQLNRLMYPGVSDYPAAVQAFQLDWNEAPTGILTVGQIHDLQFRSDLQTLDTVGFPDSFGGSMLADFAFVSGTVTILDDRIAYPINHVEISCNRSDGYCEYDQLVMMLPNEDSWAQTYHVHKFDTEFYRITRWDNQQIDAVPQSGVTACRTNSLNLNFETEEFFEIARNQGGDCNVFGTEFPRLEQPRISQIVDGSDIIQHEFSTLKKKAFEVLSSEFRSRIELERKKLEAAQ